VTPHPLEERRELSDENQGTNDAVKGRLDPWMGAIFLEVVRDDSKQT